MAFSPVFLEKHVASDSESHDELPSFNVSTNESIDVQRKVLFPQRRASVEKLPKTRKQYKELIEIALFQLNEVRSGSSRQAIVKYIRANYEVGNNAERYIRLALVKLVEHGRIVQKTGVGARGKFTLSKEIREVIREGRNMKAKTKKSKAKAITKVIKMKADGTAGKEMSKDKEISKAKAKPKIKANKEKKNTEESNEKSKKLKAGKRSPKAPAGREKKGEGQAKTKAAKKAVNETVKTAGVGRSKTRRKDTKESATTTVKAKAGTKVKEASKISKTSAKGKDVGEVSRKNTNEAENTKKDTKKTNKNKRKGKN